MHDLLPTRCELVGAGSPPGLAGRSLTPVIGGKTAKVRDALMLANPDPQRLVRDEQPRQRA